MKWISDDALLRLRDAAEEPDLEGTPYRLIRKVGAGGMSVVYLAQDARLNRNVALKIMNVSDESGNLASRMTREAQIVARVEHPAIVPLDDVGRLEDGRVFYTMKYVQGRRLDHYVASRPALTEMLRVFQRVCEAVSFAHSCGVIHRDIKPENIMVGAFGEVLVMDWGIAKILGKPGEPRTEPLRYEAYSEPGPDQTATLIDPRANSGNETADGAIIGTPAYMSPEQAAGDNQRVDFRTDVYALGAILHFILTGSPPFEAADLRTGQSQTPALRGKVQPALEATCLKALNHDSEKRYASAQAMAADISAFLDGLSVSAYKESALEKAARLLARNRPLVILILAYLLMRLLVLVFFRR